MRRLNTIMTMLAIVVSSGIMVDLLVEPVDAWQSIFASKKECTNFMKETNGNTTSQAQFMCNKLVPH